MTIEASKSRKAFLRKLYIAYLIDSNKHNLLSLEKETGMPRRTIQTSMEGLSDLGIECEFIQSGTRNRHGFYKISSWGPIKKPWIKENLQDVIDVLQ